MSSQGNDILPVKYFPLYWLFMQGRETWNRLVTNESERLRTQDRKFHAWKHLIKNCYIDDLKQDVIQFRDKDEASLKEIWDKQDESIPFIKDFKPFNNDEKKAILQKIERELLSLQTELPIEIQKHLEEFSVALYGKPPVRNGDFEIRQEFPDLAIDEISKIVKEASQFAKKEWKEVADFRNFIFYPLCFSHSKFDQGLNLSGAYFLQAAQEISMLLENIEVKERAFFQNTYFGTGCSFKESRFIKGADFSDSFFNNSCSFEKTKFLGNTTSFQNVYFDYSVDFNYSNFEKEPNFNNVNKNMINSYGAKGMGFDSGILKWFNEIFSSLLKPFKGKQK